MRRWAFQILAALFAALLATPRAGATPVEVSEAVIEIQQAPGSEACPDKQAVLRSIQRLFPERAFRQGTDASDSAARARVTIRPLPPGHEAVLTLLPPRTGERVIRDEAEDCSGLADALALAFVMLVAPPESAAESSTLNQAPKPGAASAPTRPAASVAAVRSRPAERQKDARDPDATARSPRAARAYQAVVGASLVGGLGALSEPALGIAGEVALFQRSGWGLSLQGLRLWSRPAETEGGSVALSLWGLLVAPCYRQRLSAASSLDACLRLGVGYQYAEVKGFLAPQSGRFPWLVLVPSIGYRQAFAEAGQLLSGFVRIGLVDQLRPQSFSVRAADGSGQKVQVASAPDVGVMTEIGLLFGADVF